MCVLNVQVNNAKKMQRDDKLSYLVCSFAHTYSEFNLGYLQIM